MRLFALLVAMLVYSLKVTAQSPFKHADRAGDLNVERNTVPGSTAVFNVLQKRWI